MIAVCMKSVARRVEVDALDATVRADPTSWGPSAADEAALEVALRIAQVGIAEVVADDVIAVCAGPDRADAMLRTALACGATRAVRVDLAADADSTVVAAALAAVVAGCDLVICGDHSLDRGSGSVPALVAAELGVAQALGCVAVAAAPDGLAAARRTDRGGRDLLRIGGPAVISVEGPVARLRRAGVPPLLESMDAAVEVTFPEPARRPHARVVASRPYRPRPRWHRAPDPAAPPLRRILDLTEAMTERTPPRLLELAAGPAADAIVAQLGDWGYLTAAGNDVVPTESRSVE